MSVRANSHLRVVIQHCDTYYLVACWRSAAHCRPALSSCDFGHTCRDKSLSVVQCKHYVTAQLKFVASAAQSDLVVSCPLSNNVVAKVSSSNDEHVMTLAIESLSPFLSPAVPGENSRRGNEV